MGRIAQWKAEMEAEQQRQAEEEAKKAQKLEEETTKAQREWEEAQEKARQEREEAQAAWRKRLEDDPIALADEEYRQYQAKGQFILLRTIANELREIRLALTKNDE